MYTYSLGTMRAKVPSNEVEYYISIACGQVQQGSIPCYALILNSIKMYQSFKTEYLDLCQKFGRDTKRKIKNDLSKDVKELEYRIEHVKPRVETKGWCYLYGQFHSKRELKKYEQELMYTNQLLSEI